MAVLQELTKANLKTLGLSGLSFTMPVISPQWVEEDDQNPEITVNSETLSLTPTSNWLAIFSGLINNVNPDNPLKFPLQGAKGDFITGQGVLQRLFPQQIVRLRRLMAKNFEPENPHSYERSKGNSLRQVPAFLFYTDATLQEDKEGYVAAGDQLGFSGELRFFDEQGYILHPLYVAGLLKVLLNLYPALNAANDKILNNTHSGLENQLNSIIGSDKTSTVRLVKPDGTPHTGEHITGITVIKEDSGLFSVDDYLGNDDYLQGELKREEANPSGDFKPREAIRFFIGNVTYCRMMDKVPLIECPEILIETGSSDDEDTTEEIVSLKHDFFTIKVVETKNYLIGEPNSNFAEKSKEPGPEIRLHQKVSTLPTGNHIMGGLHKIFSAEKDEKLCAAVSFDEHLPLPKDQNEVLWPEFPKIDDSIIPDTSFPSSLKEDIQAQSVATFISIEEEDTADIYVKLVGLPLGSAVRIYNRVFGEEATLQRGDGAGGICNTASSSSSASQGTLELVLKNPLGLNLENDPLALPSNAKLIFDLMINLHNGKKKLFGALEIPIGNGGQTLPAPAENVIALVDKKSICKAPILRKPKASDKVFDFGADNTIKNLLGLNDSENETENLPEDPPRLLTMARRDLLAASFDGEHWTSLLGGGRITNQLQNAEQDKGCPGAKGGKETSNVGIYTQQGLLAYDIARMALRRTTNFYARIPELAETTWTEPDDPEALTEIEETTAGRGTINGAILQNIAPFCETPELALLKLILNGNDFDFPDTLNDWLANNANEWIDLVRDKIESEIDDASEKIGPYFEKTQEIIEESKTIIVSEIEGFYASFDDLTNRVEGWIDQFDLNSGSSQANNYLDTLDNSVTEMKDQLTNTIDDKIDSWKSEIDEAVLGANNPLLQHLAPYIQIAGDEFSDQLKTNINSSLDELLGSFDDLMNKAENWLDESDILSQIKDPIKDVKNAADRLKDELIDKIQAQAENWINTFDLDGLINDLNTKLDKLENLVDDLKNQGLLEAAPATRIYNEIKREISASSYGRRDTQWALENAIANARKFIYIETPGFCSTGNGGANYSVDLINKLNNRLEENPALKVFICVPRQPDFNDSYLKWIKNEIKDRFQAINSLPVDQVVSFHPIGFPGRYTNLEQTTVIVDDVWALIGSSTFRRRGLTFDGSSDMVFTDLQQSGGSSPFIENLRLQLLKQRLGIPKNDDKSSQALQLHDFQTAFKMIRETLIAGGLGKIDRLWSGNELSIRYDNSLGQADIGENLPAGSEVTNPDGMEFNLWKAAVQAAIARCST